MSNIDKQALVIPQREKHDWIQAVMRDCDFCQQWALTVRHSDGGYICASCCDSEYTTALSSALAVALDELEAAEERYEDMLRQARSFREAHDSASEIIRQLERNKLVVKLPTTKLWAGKVACYEASEIIELLFSAGIRIQGED
ncbi:hypothetical protein QIV32_05105 [Enterobacter ludwigii]|uniref:hypothetical protein n=1 Tax=Enterobacter ludwigii TaxID=299767 RepID=UPI00234C5A7C|nr:hypothetical protein [Enterobacter ludwigii]MDC7312682.1 hypothetical protein [Enterobacter ludwigii]MDI0402734.1 hypothetical protein [Enterobacter ludwigii]MDI0410631.1 hypothetical protein [Enterobacter ludwigii]MDI0417747.1 hypothetical protein [Enterobacter ludwigii]MDI0427776.1 hypothetical protein [Enterobacter ludwigii]